MIAAIKSKIKYPTSNAPFGSAYEEHAAIKDTAAEVRALRKNGIHVSAVFMGNDGEVTNRFTEKNLPGSARLISFQKQLDV